MADPGPASFSTQANALLIKNFTFQKRNMKANFRIISFPVILFIILAIAQHYIHTANKDSTSSSSGGLPGGPVDNSPHSCGKDYFRDITGKTCDLLRPAEWPALLQIPPAGLGVVRDASSSSSSSSSSNSSQIDDCALHGSCPITLLVTGSNQSMAQSVANNFFPSNPLPTQSSNATLYMLANLLLGVVNPPGRDNFVESGFSDMEEVETEPEPEPLPQKNSIPQGKKLNNFTKLAVVNKADVNESAVNNSESPQGSPSFGDQTFGSFQLQHIARLANIQQQCTNKSKTTIPFQIPSSQVQIALKCVEGLHLWRNSSLMINEELFNSSWNGIGIAGAYDFLNSNEKNFNVNIWYNNSREGYLTRIPRAVNLASNAYLQFLKGDGVKVLLEFVKEMPSRPAKVSEDLATYIGEMFYTWVILQLFPVILTSLVYEKQENLRIMMKMHGLGDGPYWLITYAYFALVSFIYMLVFIGFGSIIGLKFFTMNAYSIQFVFYYLYMNLQIACAFLWATFFSTVRTATVISNICVFGSGLLAVTFFKTFVEDLTFPSGWLMFIEAYPGFALYRGIYEFAEYSKSGEMMGMSGMQWSDLSDKMNGMLEILIIMFAEWIIVLFVAYYLDQVMSSGSGVRKHPLFFLKNFKKKPSPSLHRPSLQRQGSHVEVEVEVEVEKPDVAQERERVEQLLLNGSRQTIISDNIKKVYPGKDGNPDKFAVKGLSLGVPQGQCFGMLGPNGAGKTSWISMMIGLTMPSSGTAFVEGLDIRTDMDSIYTSMGVCPQHDLLWETLTGREHLLFYGRLKNLKGSALTQAVEESLKGVSLFHGGVADKHAGKYSGGMKRRLSVAISLIGDPKVVYLDEPSTGLDPASRNSLWNVVKKAKQHRAIILTTHSMEEADILCDRLGIFVDGKLQCVGNSNELKARYGGNYVFTMTTSSNQEEEVENLVRQLSSKARKIYHLSGTQKFELPKKDVRIADVFQAVERAKANLTIHAWGLADTTLEDVFIKVARDAQSFKLFS